MDVRAKQQLCLETCAVTFGGLSGGFAPRHLRRSTAFLKVAANHFSTKLWLVFFRFPFKQHQS
jgi:hypothetical protein